MTHEWTPKGLQEVLEVATKYQIRFTIAEKLIFFFTDKENVYKAMQSKYPFAKKISGIGKTTEKLLHEKATA